MENAEYKVIRIINEETLIINYGYDKGAKIGDKVRIIQIGPEIYDINNDSLGTLDHIKAELEIIQTYSKFSLCQKIVRKISNYLRDPLMNFNIENKSIEKLNVDSNEINSVNLSKDTVIHVGDNVEIL